jgi:hypothetical protein
MEKRQPAARKIKGRLLEWMGICHERELQLALQELDEHFAAWRNGQLSPFELNARIHEFHQGSSRQLYVKYVGIASHMRGGMLSQAILRGLVEESELRADVREAIQEDLEKMRRFLEE